MSQIKFSNRYSDIFQQKRQIISKNKQSKFSLIFNQAFKQVKKKLGNQQQSLPIIKLTSYQRPNHSSQKTKSSFNNILSQRQQKPFISPLNRQKSMNIVSKKGQNISKKYSVNKILWQKKMSLQTLRISSTKRPSKIILSKQIPKQSLKHLRQKTSFQPKQQIQQEQQSVYNHMSIMPINLLTSRQQRQKYISNRKKLQDKFKATMYVNNDEKHKYLNNKCLTDNREKQMFKNKQQLDRDEDQFINFVKEKISVNLQN